MKLKSPTNEVLHVTLLSGQAMRIGPDGRDVPEMFRKAAFAKGAIPVDTSIEQFTHQNSDVPEATQKQLLIDGIKKMLVENTDDFTGAGLPNRKVLSGIVGWGVSVEELAVAWADVQAEGQGAE